MPSFLHHPLACSPTLRQRAVKELEQWDLLSYPAVNNAIRVTDCREGVELRLPPMCVSLRTHTWRSAYDSSNVRKSSNAHSASSQSSRNPFNLQTGDTERPWLCHYQPLSSSHLTES